MKTSIVILTYNKIEYTRQCIDSIRKYTKQGTYEIVIVDNHSTDGTEKWLKQQKDVRTIFNRENMGFPTGCNQGMTIAKGDNVLLLNNDVIVTNNWLSNLLQALYSNPEIGAVGAVTNNCSYGQTIAVQYKSIQEMQRFAKDYNISTAAKWDERLKLVGFCLLIKKEVVEKVGLLDEMFSPGNFEDDDYSVRIRRAGYKLLLCRDTFIYHFGSVSFRDKASEYNQLLQTNAQKFENKWGYSSNYSMMIRQEIINFIDEPRDEAFRVLEVGCACGATLLQIRNQFRNAALYGIELNANAAQDASAFADVCAADVEALELPYPKRFFQYIILADILEHLKNPWGALQMLYQYLAPGGKILASIPNVMHFSVIRNLLYGNWSYEDAGILDKTHLRFFTLNEIKKMFFGVGFSQLQCSTTQIACSESDKQYIDTLSAMTENKFKDQYLAYQYLISAPKGFVLDELREILLELARDINVMENIKDLNRYPIETVIESIDRDVSNQTDVLNRIASANFAEKKFDCVIPYLQQALRINSEDSNTLYNFSYVLFRLQEYDAALNYMHGIINKTDNDVSLIEQINSAKAQQKLDSSGEAE